MTKERNPSEQSQRGREGASVKPPKLIKQVGRPTKTVEPTKTVKPIKK